MQALPQRVPGPSLPQIQTCPFQRGSQESWVGITSLSLWGGGGKAAQEKHLLHLLKVITLNKHQSLLLGFLEDAKWVSGDSFTIY